MVWCVLAREIAYYGAIIQSKSQALSAGNRQVPDNPIEYFHSSARFYLTGVQRIYPVTNLMEMEELNFNLKLQ
jgi:hypothetical protein